MITVKHLTFSSLLFLTAFYANAQSNVVSGSEIKNQRDMYTKVFDKGNGLHEAVISSSPVHYQKNGVWEEINTDLISSEGEYKNETNSLQSYFPLDVSNSKKIKLVVNGTEEIFISAQKKFVYADKIMGRLISIADPTKLETSVRGNSLEYVYNLFNCTDAFTVLNGKIKNDIVLTKMPNLLNMPELNYFGVEELIALPAGWKISTADKSDLSLTSSSLLILDANGKHVLTIPAPVIFDKKGLQTDGANPTEAKYCVKQISGGWSLTTLVSADWLKDENTEYPVTIDPTVTIPGTTGGWQSPNNWVDNPGFVFLGVCCSNLTHRAWIKFNTTGIPDSECILTVELQVNVTTVVATTPELVHVNDVTGAFGPYGGIIPAAYTDFGNGYYTSFTINGTGLYGYYNLGLGANTVLQSQLPVNWFQVGMMFDNEPSTNYKIINGTSSNLRVTYSACVLPVEVVSFDATCTNDRVELDWTTASQINNDYFTIERSADGIIYSRVGTVPGAGNGNQTNSYSFVDTEPLEGTSYYSLNQTDFNGRFVNLNSVAVNCNGTGEFMVYPNPGTGIFRMEKVEKNSHVIVTDVLGQIVFQTKVVGEKTEINISDQLNGVYFVQVFSKNELVSRKIILNK